MDLIGKTLGKYEIVEELGKGGMATVYKAYQTHLQRHVAIKVLLPSLAEDIELVKRFLREARSAAALSHPNVIEIYDVGSEGNTHYIVSEFLEGSTLGQLRAQAGALPPERVLSIVRQVAHALDHAHTRGFIHRDVKPSNIMVNPDQNDHVTLMDFGLVQVSGGSKLTRTGFIMGTPDYMSPEQAKGEAIDHRTDIYSLGVTLYHMLAGEVPFEKPTPHAVLMAHIMEEPPSLALPNWPPVPEIEAVVHKAMAKIPAGRYEWAGDVAQSLEMAITRFAAGEPGATLAAASTQRQGPPPGDRRYAVTPPRQAPPPGDARYHQVPPATLPLQQGPPTSAAPALQQPPTMGMPYPQTPPTGAAPQAARPKWLWPVLGLLALGGLAVVVIAAILLRPVITRLVAGTATVTTAGPTPSATFTLALDAPFIEGFQVNPQEQVQGGEVTLSWRVRGRTTKVEIAANSEVIPALPAEGTLPYTADRMTLFVLTAYNEGMSASKSIELRVLVPTPTPTTAPVDSATATLVGAPPTATDVPPSPTLTVPPPTETPTLPSPSAATPTTVPPPPTPKPTTPPTGPVESISFEQWGTWKRGDQPYGEFVQTQEQVKVGSYSAKLSYDFPQTDQDFVVFRNLTSIAGEPKSLSAWVYGDGSGHFVNVWIQDAQNQVWSVHMGKIGPAGWQQMTGSIAPGLAWPSGPVFGPDNGAIDYPIRFYGVVLDRPGSGPQSGHIYLDDLSFSSEQVSAPQPGGESSTGQTGRIVFTVRESSGYALYSADPNWDGMRKIGDTDWENSTCAEGGIARTGDGKTINLRPLDKCAIAGTVGSCPSPNGQYKANTARKGDGYAVTLHRANDGSMLEVYYVGPLNIHPGLNWAPDSSHFLFTVDQSVYRADVGHAGYKMVISFKHDVWPAQYAPDGTLVYYPKPVLGENMDISVIRPDGTGERNLTNSPNTEKLCPRWREQA